MKKLSNLKGAKKLNKQEQQAINGGIIDPNEAYDCQYQGYCGEGMLFCANGECIPVYQTCCPAHTAGNADL